VVAVDYRCGFRRPRDPAPLSGGRSLLVMYGLKPLTELFFRGVNAVVLT
jgi:hypothetical protein